MKLIDTGQLPVLRRHLPLCKPPFPNQVEANINESLTRVADEVTKPRDMLYKVIIFNMTYLGPSHASCLHDAARILSDQLTNDPDRGLLSVAQMRHLLRCDTAARTHMHMGLVAAKWLFRARFRGCCDLAEFGCDGRRMRTGCNNVCPTGCGGGAGG